MIRLLGALCIAVGMAVAAVAAGRRYEVPAGALPADRVASVRGKRVFEEFNCRACHRLGEYGGSNAPALDGVGKKFVDLKGSRASAAIWFRHHVMFPDDYPGPEKAFYRMVRMPRFEFTRDEIRYLVHYLLSLG